jgi:amino acid transporter
LDWCWYFLLINYLRKASYAELGSAIPVNGGPHAYLQHALGSPVAFLFSWSTITAHKPSSAAMVSMVFAEYLNRVLFWSLSPHDTIPLWANKLTSLTCVWVVVGLNAMGSQWGVKSTNALTVIKLMALLAIAVIGIITLGN